LQEFGSLLEKGLVGGQGEERRRPEGGSGTFYLVTQTGGKILVTREEKGEWKKYLF